MVANTTTNLVSWVGDSQVRLRKIDCVICGNKLEKKLILEAVSEHDRHELYRCDECGSHLFHPFKAFEYAQDHPPASIKVYIEQIAGIKMIAGLLCQIAHLYGKGSKFLDIGCNFGYSLDFAARELGWDVMGAEPSSSGREGAKQLELDIRQKFSYEIEDLKPHSQDVVFNSEVIEHVEDPIEFAKHLKSFLKPGGILILTTPDISTLNQETPESAAVPILSPGLHLCLFTKDSLESCLKKAGFKHILIGNSGIKLNPGYSLVVYASDQPFELDTQTKKADQRYLNFLNRREQAVTKGTSLWSGYAYRLLKEYVPNGQYVEAEEVSQQFRQLFPEIYATDFISKLSEIKETEELINRYPACAGVVRFYEGMLDLRYRNNYAQAREHFQTTLNISDTCYRLKAAVMPEIMNLRWLAVYHQGLAYLRLGALEDAKRCYADICQAYVNKDADKISRPTKAIFLASIRQMAVVYLQEKKYFSCLKKYSYLAFKCLQDIPFTIKAMRTVASTKWR